MSNKASKIIEKAPNFGKCDKKDLRENLKKVRSALEMIENFESENLVPQLKLAFNNQIINQTIN